MIITALDTYQRARALDDAPLTVDCPTCHATRSERCRSTRTPGYTVPHHKTRHAAVAAWTDERKLAEVEAMRADQEQLRQTTAAQVNRWAALDTKKRR